MTITPQPHSPLTMRLSLALTLLIGLATGARAQESTAPTDSTFTALVDVARAEAAGLEGEQRDRFWQEFAGEAFAFYRAHPDTLGGRDAIAMAFRIWGNDGTVNDITEALSHIDADSDVWNHRLLRGIELAYMGEGRTDEYFDLLHSLGSRLTHPKARSAVLLRLGKQSALEGKDTEAHPYFERVVALEADSADVAESEGFLYQFEHLAVGMEAPDFIAQSLAGDTLRLSDLRGRVVLLDFWATWCSPCLPEIPHLIEAYSMYRAQGFVIVGVSHDWEQEALVSMVEDKDMAWPHIWEPSREEGELARRYNVRWLPRSFLIDREGRIVAKDLRGEAVAEAVAKLL